MLKPFCLTIKNWCKDTHILLKSLYLVFGSYYLYRRFLFNSFNDLFIRSIRQDFFQMLENPLIRFLGSAVALSSLLGATGNHPAYAPLLKAMWAADERDDVFASVCYCPITDLDHADMAYEWLYGNTESRKSLSASKQALSQELAAQFPSYINSLGLKKADGTALDADNYLDYIKQILIKSAQEAKRCRCRYSRFCGGQFQQYGSQVVGLQGVEDFANFLKLLMVRRYGLEGMTGEQIGLGQL